MQVPLCAPRALLDPTMALQVSLQRLCRQPKTHNSDQLCTAYISEIEIKYFIQILLAEYMRMSNLMIDKKKTNLIVFN
jgi:hypothetical protein